METTYFIHETPGVLQFSGTDRVDFIQRQSTNDVKLLASNRSVTTVLTNPAARILDVLQLFETDGKILAVTVPGRAAATWDFLRRRIFFNDNVSVKDVSAEKTTVEVNGPDAGTFLTNVGVASPPDINEVAVGEIGGEPMLVVGTRGLNGVGFRLMAGISRKESLLQAFADAGVTPLTSQAYDLLRIEAGLPAAPEMNEEFTPLETQLGDAISHTKGCYTGQEIIARQITYDKITRQMVGLRLESDTKPGAAVRVEGKKAGTLTSTILSPKFGPIALAVVKKANSEVGTKITVEENGNQVMGEVVALPFAGSE